MQNIPLENISSKPFRELLVGTFFTTDTQSVIRDNHLVIRNLYVKINDQHCMTVVWKKKEGSLKRDMIWDLSLDRTCRVIREPPIGINP